MSLISSLNTLSFNAAAYAAAEAKSLDLNSMVDACKARAREIQKNTSTVSGAIGAGTNQSTLGLVSAISSPGAVLNFADPFMSAFVSII